MDKHQCSKELLCIAKTCFKNKVHCNECKSNDHRYHGRYVIPTSLFTSKLRSYKEQSRNLSKKPLKNLLSDLKDLQLQMKIYEDQVEKIVEDSIPDGGQLKDLDDVDNWEDDQFLECLETFTFSVTKN